MSARSEIGDDGGREREIERRGGVGWGGGGREGEEKAETKQESPGVSVGVDPSTDIKSDVDGTVERPSVLSLSSLSRFDVPVAASGAGEAIFVATTEKGSKEIRRQSS